MKKLIANFFVVVTLLTGSALFASANPSTNTAIDNGDVKTTFDAGFFRAPSFSTRSHQIWLNGGTNAYVSLSGDGDTDLDLYVYDSAGRLVGSSTRNGDDEDLDMVIYRGGYFTIRVVNRGDVYNDYRLSVTPY